MNISLNWLRDFVDWTGSAAELDALLTRAGVKVESITERGARSFRNVVIAQILESIPHPNAERLSVCRVDGGSGAAASDCLRREELQSLATRCRLRCRGPCCQAGSKSRSADCAESTAKGMLCSATELGIAEDAEGLLILPRDAPVGRPLSELYPADTILELEITPNRPDWLSHVGVAREIAAFAGRNLRLASVDLNRRSRSRRSAWSPFKRPDVCPLYSVRRIRNVKVGPSPRWLSERLAAVGLRSINNVVDVTNYVMLELGQPLHAFDASKLRGGIIVRSARGGREISRAGRA